MPHSIAGPEPYVKLCVRHYTSSIEAGFGASGVACVDAANARLASARINARIFVSAAEPKRAMIGDFG